MDAGIELFVKESFIEDKADTFRESFEVFERSNVIAGYNDEFNAILMEEGDLDRPELLSSFEDLVISNLAYILLLHGIKVADETPISLMNHICKGLTDVEFYLDGVEILRIIESDLDTEEKVSQILQCVTGVDDQLILNHLFKVNPTLIDRIAEVFEKNVFETKEALEQRAKEHSVLNDITNITRFLTSDNLIGVNLIKAGVRVNAEFLQYIRYFEQHLDELKPGEIARELFVLITMSCDGNKNVLMTYSKNSNILFHELDKVSKVYSELNSLISSFDRYMLQRSSLAVDNNKEIK